MLGEPEPSVKQTWTKQGWTPKWTPKLQAEVDALQNERNLRYEESHRAGTFTMRYNDLDNCIDDFKASLFRKIIRNGE